MIDPTIEKYLQNNILPELEKGRPNWDRPHTIAVVENLKDILKHSKDLNLDGTVLIITAYAHDWGYSGLFKDGKPLQLNEIMDAKEEHMRIGAEKLKKMLENAVFDELTLSQKERAVHLVKMHDVLPLIKEPDERVLLEADTLGALDVKKVTPAFDQMSNKRWMYTVRKKRLPLFITEYSKKKFEELFGEREKFYVNRA